MIAAIAGWTFVVLGWMATAFIIGCWLLILAILVVQFSRCLDHTKAETDWFGAIAGLFLCSISGAIMMAIFFALGHSILD